MHAIAMRRQDYDYERRVIVGECDDWGRWIEAHADFEGYPSMNILAAFIGGDGGGFGGHRILCLDMPNRVYCTHQRILRLPETEQDAIQIRHVTVLKDDGTVWSVSERCLKVGISDETYRKRLSRAYQRIMGINPL